MQDFKWPAPIQTDPSQRNLSLQCDYHRDNRHETNRCCSLKFMVERLIRAGHLRRYIREVDHEEEPAPIVDRIKTGVAMLPEPRPTINYILGGPLDDWYQSKRQQKKLLRVATVKAEVNPIHTSSSQEEPKPIDDPISFPPINPNRVIMPYYDALVLTLYISGFDVHRVLVVPSSLADLLQMLAFNTMKLSPLMLNSVGQILSSFNGATTVNLGDITLPVQAGPVTQQILFLVVEDLGPYNCIVGKA